MLACNQTITVWNKWRDPDDKQSPEVYYRHVLPVLCKYDTTVIRLIVSDGVVIKNTQEVIIPLCELYKHPAEWNRLNEESEERTGNRFNLLKFNVSAQSVTAGQNGRNTYFTLQEGDVIALGDNSIEITGAEPFRKSDVINVLKPNVFVIKTVRDNTFTKRGRHFKVEGV